MKNIKIPCNDYELAADWYEGKNDEVLLAVPGWSSNKGRYHDLVSAIVEQAGTSALVIDLSGHGDSPFELAERAPKQNYEELVTVYDWLQEQHPDKKINVLGSSYGGFLAAILVADRDVGKLVLRVPAINRPEDFDRKWKDIDREANRGPYRHDAAAVAKHPLFAGARNFKGKTFVVVHQDDVTVPSETTDVYIQAFQADKYVAKGLDHFMTNYLDKPDKLAAYQKAIADWLNKN